VEHVTHFPYVDIATCDANTRELVERVLPKLPCPREPLIIQSGHLEEVLDAVRAFKTALP
jgi:hypothetical protein